VALTPLAPREDPVALLLAVLDALAAEQAAELPGIVALERARALLAGAERLKTLALVALADVDTRELHALDGAASAASWVADQQIPGADRRDVTLARRLPTTPRVTEQMLAGRLGAQAAAQVAAALAKARPFLDRPDRRIDGQPGEEALRAVLVEGITTLLTEQTGGAPADDPQQAGLRTDLTRIVETAGSQAARLEEGLVLLAQRSAPRLLRGCLSLLLDALLPAQHDARALRAEHDAGLELFRDPLGSGWAVRGQLDDVTGELLSQVLAAEQATDPDSPADTSAWRAAAADPALGDLPPEDWPTGQARPRTRPTRQHDALGRALRRLLDSAALGTRDKAAPHLLVTVDQDYLSGRPGALPARTAGGSHLTCRQLAALGCDVRVTRLVLDAGRRVLEASHTQRTATALERLIVHTTWAGRCAVAGCARGPNTGHRLTPHHAELYSTTRTTSLADTVPLCDSDHDLLHRRRRALRLRDGRWVGPDGWTDALASA
jgi:hypothetical protein